MSTPMPELPDEIWLQIYEQLCPHCQSKNIPDFGDEYEVGKSALAALSLTNRAARVLSQPILYHCFYHYENWIGISKFLRTLISKPQLAEHVRVLSLPPGQDEVEHATRDDIESWSQAGLSLEIPTPEWVSQALSQNDSSQYAVFDEESRLRHHNLKARSHGVTYADLIKGDFRLWQQLLTIGLVSNGLTHLAVYNIPKSIEYCVPVKTRGSKQPDEKPFAFPNLLAFSCGCLGPQDDIVRFLSQAPLLERIAGEHQIHFDTRSSATAECNPPTSFKNVDTLSIVCGPFNQGYMLQLCDQVRDLEMHSLSSEDLSWKRATKSSFQVWDAWPTSVKNQLRRLRWSSSQPYDEPQLGGDDQGLILIPHLPDFQSLETLEIEHLSLYHCLKRGMDPNTPDQEALTQLPTVLPRTLQLLCIHYVVLLPLSTLLIELDALISAKQTTLPRLSVVQINLELFPVAFPFGLPEYHRELPRKMESLGVVSTMKNAGIELRFDTTSTMDSDRGLLAPVPGNLSQW